MLPFLVTACIVNGTAVKLEETSVKPPGHEAFTVNLYELAVSAELPPRCGDPLALHIGGPLAFTATRDNVWLWLRRDVVTADGMVTVAKGAQVVDACIRNGRVFATAIMTADDVLEGENKRPDQVVRNVELPCDALSLDRVDADETDDSFADADEADHYWHTRRGNKVVLRKEPKAKAAARTIEVGGCEGDACIGGMRELERRGSWVRVEAGHGGVAVRGWARARDLKSSDNMVYGGLFCSGDHHGDTFGFGFSGTATIREGTVRQNTIVYAGTADGAWGRFVAPTRVRVLVRPNEPWATLTSVPGISGGWHGMVPLDTVTLDPLPATNP